MLEIVQSIQADKVKLIIDMHRLRKRVFKDKFGWNVRITPSGLEVDDFDLPDAVYLLAVSDEGIVEGSMRLLPTTGPTMIKDIWPHFLADIDMSADPSTWEVSRFAVDCLVADPVKRKKQSVSVAFELFCGLAELSILCGIKKLFALYDVRLEQLLQKLNCQPFILSPRIPIEQQPCRVGCYITDERMLKNIRSATGITKNLIAENRLPPILQTKGAKNTFFHQQEEHEYAI